MELPGGRTLLRGLDHNGMTPLMYAARVGQKEAVELLLSSVAGRSVLYTEDRFVCVLWLAAYHVCICVCLCGLRHARTKVYPYP